MTTHERREFSRIDHRFTVEYHQRSAIDSVWRRGTLLNLSAGGIRIRTEDEIENGGNVEIRLELPSNAKHLETYGKVMWSRAMGGGITEYGVEFSRITKTQQKQIDECVMFLKSS